MEKIPSFVKLKKFTKNKNNTLKRFRFAIIGDSATQHLSTAIEGYAAMIGYYLDVFDSDYDQVMAQTMDQSSELYNFQPNFILLFLCTEKLYEAFCKTPTEQRSGFADSQAKRIISYWSSISRFSSATILHMLYLENDDRVFGSYAYDLEISFIYQLKKLNMLLIEKRNEFKNVYLFDIEDVRQTLGKDRFTDKKMYYLAKMATSLEALPYIAKKITNIIAAIDGKVKKCIVLDLDNTLWGGVIGDDGMEGIEIGELGQGRAFADFQLWLKELRKRGILLGICSKNNEDTAKEPFLNHPEMVLRMEDISIFVANWNDKATNLRYIQKTLNIGMDSIVFLDDNPFERNLVRNSIEEITVPELPEDPAEYTSYLQSLNLFETISYSENDRNRTAQYQAEVNRLELENEYESFDDYLISLDMKATAAPFDAFHYPRIAQLTQRSNQFNLRTIRYTEDEIRELAESDNCFTLYFTLQDKFGDYGLISVVVMDKKDNETLFISEWLMSCRVLKRGMEEFIINKIITQAIENGYKKVLGEYIPTNKNAMVKDIYSQHGFKEISENIFEIDVDAYEVGKTFIKEE